MLAIRYEFGKYRTNERSVLIRGASRSTYTGKVGVVFAHGATLDAQQVLTPVGRAVRLLAKMGHPCISADNGGPTPFGNAVASDANGGVDNAVTYIRAQTGAHASKILLVGASMGALNLLNWAKNNASQVVGFAGIIPLVDLADLHDNNRGGYASVINTAYTNLAGYNAQIAARNPTANPNAFPFPKRLWYSTTDPLVIPSTVTAFAAASGATATGFDGTGHDVQGFDGSAVASYLHGLI